MKKSLTLLPLLLLTISGFAASLHDQLCAFNFNWTNYFMQAPKEDAQVFRSDKELIQKHLQSVLSVLRTASTLHLNTEQLQNRQQMIAWLDGYRTAGNFPMNYYRAERIPVFIDEHGTHCAVGYLMMKSGHEEMAQRISRADNYVWVKDLRDTGVPAWQQASGLSFAELALIQGAYDFYPHNSYYLANRYETPQQPKCTTAYFGEEMVAQYVEQSEQAKKKNFVWCKGEGNNGVLNGKWEQLYAPGIPWIEGYYTNGKRTGQWKEYYPGTNLLCRTERWSNDKLNGTRVRYDRAGNVIEEICFTGGVAVSKINYDLNSNLTYVRLPMDSTRLATKVYNSRGELIAYGVEVIYNPGNLLWFQNIELTALNAAQITARSSTEGNADGALNSEGGYYATNLFSNPPLVEYKKEGRWIYYRDTVERYASVQPRANTFQQQMAYSFEHYGNILSTSVYMFNYQNDSAAFDSIVTVYSDNQIQRFHGFVKGKSAFHVHMAHHVEATEIPSFLFRLYGYDRAYYTPASAIKETGYYDEKGQRIGEWKYYNQNGTIWKTENYLIPTAEQTTAGR